MSSNDNSNIARHTVSGSLYSVASSGVTLTFGFIRAALMARLLFPEDFGVATLALFYLNFASQLGNVGIDNALIHRKGVDEKIFTTYFTMRLGLVVGSTVLLAALLPIISRVHPDIPLLIPVLLAYLGVNFFKGFNEVQMTILSKQLAFRSLAVTDVMSSITMTIVGPTLAWLGYGVWSIVGEMMSGAVMRGFSIWILHRAWRPRFGWDGESARWLWNYGIRMWAGANLNFVLDRFDDWWIGSFLGSSPLGYYSRAYEFAGYPRRVIGNPFLSVFFPTFAHLQEDRLRLSRAFFRTTSLMFRLSALFSLLLVLTAPEFIEIVIGEKWLPMRLTFQLMIVYTLLDPLTMAANNLLAATGYPGIIVRVRIIQAIAFIPAVIGLGWLLGIEGVALAADLMVLTGAILLFAHTRRIVDYSSRLLWFWPIVAMLLTGAVVLALTPVWAPLPSWLVFIGKAAVILFLYVTILWLAERKQLLVGLRMIWGLIRPRLKTS